MKSKIIISSVIILFALIGCQKVWNEHFNVYPETVDQNFFEAMKNETDISQFVQHLIDNRFDTLFQSDIPYTVFVPTNEALQSINLGDIDTTMIKYHIVSQLIQSEGINETREILTISKKFASVENNGTDVEFDGILVNYESPLFNNGKYFIINQVAEPKSNLYEFFSKNNLVLKEYIDSQDSVMLDLINSTPIGFNKEGNTVFDSATYVYNIFEETYFPVSKEFRNKTATIVFPQEEDYQNGLSQMAQNLGSGYSGHEDIPAIWQQEILVPYLLKRGVFENSLEPEEFENPGKNKRFKMKNILGDSVQINYVPTGKVVCSNGYAYNYSNFQVPDSLYNTGSKFEAEDLLIETGINKFAWDENVNIETDTPIEPYQAYVKTASNDSIIQVLFPLGYTGKYSVEFETQYLFPRKYIMVVATNMDVGGIYNIYVNDELVETFDYYKFILYRGIMPSVTGEYYIPQGRFNKFDMYLDNITEFSRAKIRVEYKEPGRVYSNGLVLDYVEFIPVNN